MNKTATTEWWKSDLSRTQRKQTCNPQKLINVLDKRKELRKSQTFSLTELSQATDHKFKDQEFFFWYLKKGVISK